MAKTFWAELLERRVPQFMGGYVAVSWGLISFTEFLTKHYLLSRHWIDGVLTLVVVLAPGALLLAYTHGRPGRDRWGRLEKVALPLNLLAAASLVTLQLQGKDLGRTAETVTAVDEEGRTIERLVAKESYLRRAGLFAWENATGEESLDWLELGLPLMLDRDLEQNIFFDGHTPFARGVHSRLARAGHGEGVGVPLALAREVSEDLSQDYFVLGELGREDERFSARLEVYRTETASRAAEVEVAASDPMALIDEASVALGPHLDLQELSKKALRDLPVAEQLSASLPALEAYVEGSASLSFENDFSGAAESFRRAVEEDPDFAVAHLELAEALGGVGENAKALEALDEALQRDYRLTEYEKFTGKGFRYYLTEQVEKIVPLYRTWTELYPDDLDAHYRLASAYLQDNNRVDEALATYRRIVELEPSADGARLEAARLLKVKGDLESALEVYLDYAERHPEAPAAHLMLGGTLWAAGDLAGARASYEKASFLASKDIRPARFLAILDQAEGRLDGIDSRLAALEAQARSPSEKANVLNARAAHLTLQGRWREAAELHQRFLAALVGKSTPIDQLVNEMLSMDRQVRAGRLEEALARLEEMRRSLQPPMDQLTHLGFMIAYSAAEQPEATAPHLEVCEKLIRGYRRDDLLHLTAEVRGHMQLQEGLAEEAAATFREAIALSDASPMESGDMFRHTALRTYLGNALRLAGDLKGAEASLKEALRWVPAYPETHLRLAQVYRSRGEEELAREHLGRTLAIWGEADPGYGPADEARVLAAELGMEA